jgi:hypothetical protein
MKSFIRSLFCSVVALSFLCLFKPASAGAQEVNLLAFGDWGVDSPAHAQVAETMAEFVAKSTHPFDAALSLGDNFYVPLHSANDPAFDELFEKTYDAKRLNFPFYAVLGNHDYDEVDGHFNYEWELGYSVAHPDSRWKMPALWYRLDLPADHPLVTILMLDSNKEGITKHDFMTSAQWDEETAWLTKQLAGPRAAWTICCAHHNMYSNGHKGDNGVLVEEWGSLFEKYKVDFYLCGHNHSLQHLEIPGVFTSYVISGGGGAKRDAMLRDDRGPYSKSITGFAALDFQPDQVTVHLLAGDGTVLHEFTRTKAGQVNVTLNTPSDPHAKHPLRVIQGYSDSPTTAPSTQP